MDIVIGVQHTARDISLETEETPEQVSKKVTDAITSGGLLTLTDSKGRTVIVPAEKIAYVDLGPASGRRVGFGALA
jgi:ABC-type Fe3+-hydroxamate transport system substrate-binding protein